MAFLALAAPAFVGGLVTGFLKPSLPFRKGKRGEGFVLWPELAQVSTVSPSKVRLSRQYNRSLSGLHPCTGQA